ncbi:hypothetical protein EK904_011374 [Melospiza melodia maxima]|nr:hypothetical protein EK904_011374 [Melospiza melodia maxima]
MENTVKTIQIVDLAVFKQSLHSKKIQGRAAVGAESAEHDIFDKEAKDLEREVCFIDIASDEIPERYYKESEDPKYFKSQKTGRGQLKEGWRETHQPIMCSYKLVTVKFEVWGLQTRVEQFVHKVVRDILLIGHRQAFAWVDEWYDMTMDDVREYEKNMHEKTNIKVCNQHSSTVDEIESHAKARVPHGSALGSRCPLAGLGSTGTAPGQLRQLRALPASPSPGL